MFSSLKGNQIDQEPEQTTYTKLNDKPTRRYKMNSQDKFQRICTKIACKLPSLETHATQKYVQYCHFNL